MFEFIKLQYQMGKITAAQVGQFAAQGWISESHAREILGLPYKE